MIRTTLVLLIVASLAGVAVPAGASQGNAIYVGEDDRGDASPPLPSFDILNVTVYVAGNDLHLWIAFDSLSKNDSERYIPIALTGATHRLHVDCDIGQFNPAQSNEGRCSMRVEPRVGTINDVAPTNPSMASTVPFSLIEGHILAVVVADFNQSLGDSFRVSEVYVAVQPEVGVANGDGPLLEVGVPIKPDEFLETTDFLIQAPSLQAAEPVEGDSGDKPAKASPAFSSLSLLAVVVGLLLASRSRP